MVPGVTIRGNMVPSVTIREIWYPVLQLGEYHTQCYN